jgi:type I restriction enzyme S subunit
MEDFSDLPVGWAKARLEDIVSSNGVFSDGDWIESKDQDQNGSVRLVQLADIGEMRFLDKSQRYMDAERAEAMGCMYLCKGDLLISRLGDPLGKACLYPGNDPRAVTAVDVCVLRPCHEGVEPRLFGFFLNSSVLRREIDAQSSGTTRKRITGKKLKSLPVRVPPTNEQRRIVDKIESLFAQLDHGEASLRDVQKLLARYRQSVLKAAVTGQLTADWRAENADRLESGHDLLERILQARRENWQGRGKYKEPAAPDIRDLLELPEGWVWASVGQLAEVIGGLTKNSKRSTLPLKKPMLRVANVYQNRLELEDVHDTGVSEGELSRVTLQDSDILVVEGNGSKGQIGRMAVWRDEIPGAVHQNHLIKVRMIEKLLSQYSMWWFQSLYGRQNIEKVASSTSGLYTLSISKIESLVIPLPSLHEVEQITEAIDEAFSKIGQLEEWCQTELTRSSALRQSILKDAFAGKLVPQDPNDEPASQLLARIRAECDAAAPKKRTRKKVTA